MAVNVDGPVGIVQPGSWWRTQKVTNFSDDQRKVFDLLAKIPTDRGGKKEAFRDKVFVFVDGKCNPELAKAIFEFQQFWKAKGFFKNIDGVVDPDMNTIKKLNELAEEKPEIGVIADIVIKFRGADNEDPLTPEDVLPRSKILAYQPMDGVGEDIRQHPFDGRALIRVGRQTKTIGDESFGVFTSVTADLLKLLGSIKALPGKIYIYGSSSGARNAIDFSQRLRAAGPRFRAHFVAALDAPFFDPDTEVKPTKEGRDPGALPVFKIPTGPALIKHNFFQTRGNHAKATRLGLGRLAFTSNMFNEEIHGEIPGFTNHNVDDQMTQGGGDDGFHGQCITQAEPVVHGQIADDLLRGRNLRPNVG